MTHSLIGADRNTNLKIVVVALVGAIAVVSIGIAARVNDAGSLTAQRTDGPVLKAGTPTTLTTRDTAIVR